MTSMTQDAELADNCQKGIKFLYQSLAQQMDLKKKMDFAIKPT